MKPTRISRRKFLGTAGAAATLTMVPAPLRATAKLSSPGAAPATVRIQSAALPILFDPDQALGSSMDILSHDVVEKIYT